jgi:RNA polymerase sigma factor (sigma-70 family)
LDRFAWHTRTQQAVPVDPEADAKVVSLLETSLGALPFDERRLVEAKYFARRSVREIAEYLDLTEEAVESRLVRIRRKLKETILEGLKRD